MNPFKSTRTFVVGALIAVALMFASVVPQPQGSPLASFETAAHAQAMSDYLENKLIDAIFRAQTYTPPSSIYVGLSTAACSDSSVGTEVSGSNYARASVTGSLANWAGSQSTGSTTASTGTGGVTSNNNAITFSTPSGSWGTVTYWFLADAVSSGNVLFCAALTASKTINSGDTVSFAAGALTVTLQ